MIPKAIPMQVQHIFFLMIVFILYVIFGGLIFMLLESPQERIKRAEVESILVDLKEHIRALNHTFLTENYIHGTLNRLLEAKENNLIDIHGNQSMYINWSFMNSFFFAITVITTIGYGHLTPSTFFGKIFCIGYALFGIPITGLLIGSMADRFEKLYSSKEPTGRKSFGKVYHRQLSDRFRMLKRALISLVPWFFVFLVIPAIIFTCIEQWSFMDGFYYCFVTLSTIGFGDFVAGSFEHDYVWIYKIIVVFWIIFGLAYLSMILNFISQSLRSRQLSNVMHSLRYRLSSNPNFKHRHPGHFKRQQSTPVVIFPQQNNKAKGPRQTRFCDLTNDNNNFLKTSDQTNTSILDIESISNARKHGFWNSLFKHFKINSKNNKQIQNQNCLDELRKTSIRCTLEDKVSLRQATSLPDLAPNRKFVDGKLEVSNINVFMAECIQPTCSMCEYESNSVTKM